MNTDPMDGLLRRLVELRGRDVASEACLDANVVAALADGSLLPEERQAAETHAATCARCRAVLAAVIGTEHVMPAAAAPAPWWRRGWNPGWLVPLTAAAAAVAVWLSLPGPASGPSLIGEQASAPSSETVPLTEPLAPASTAEPAAPPAARDAPARAADTGTTAAGAQAAAGAPPAADAFTAPPRVEERPAALAAARARTLAASAPAPVIESPDPNIRWRVVDGRVERSTDGGGAWTAQASGVAATAGHAPSASICWIVGPGGMVLLTTDGETWQERRLPEPADLVAIEAADAVRAVVTAADGRRFSTADGGVTWIAVPLQGF